jgi:hypothetical protein
VLAPALYGVADGLRFTRASEDAWVTHVALNALSASVLLHVAVGRRWPFAGGAAAAGAPTPPTYSEPEPERHRRMEQA